MRDMRVDSWEGGKQTAALLNSTGGLGVRVQPEGCAARMRASLLHSSGVREEEEEVVLHRDQAATLQIHMRLPYGERHKPYTCNVSFQHQRPNNRS